MKKIVILIIFTGIDLTSLVAQSKKDSLWRVWNDPQQVDTMRLKAIQALTWPMLNVNLDSAFLLASAQLKFAQERNSKKWIGKAYYNQATYYYYKSDYVNSLSHYQKSLELRKEIGDRKGEAAIYGNIGLIYSGQGNSVKDLEYQLKSLAINETLKDSMGMTSNYNNIANIYHSQRDSTHALEYYYKTLRIYEAMNDEVGIALIYNNLGTLYKNFDLWDKSLYYLKRSLEMRSAMKDRLGIAINYINLGTTYAAMRDFQQAKENTLLSIENFIILGDSSSLANAYYTLGDIAFDQKQFTEAIKWCKATYDIAVKTHKAPIESAACNCLYKSHKELGNAEMALKYFEDYYFLEDSLHKEDLDIALKRLEFEKELLSDSLDRVEEKNLLTIAHQKELSRKNSFTRVILVGGIGLLLLALFLLSRMLRFQRNSQLFQLKSEQLEKQQLVNEISILKTQVNPHFLFNSLSILSSLVRVDPDLSERFIDQLSRSYRYILEQKDQTLVTLRTELLFIESYSFLLKIRFENKFKVDIQLPDHILDKYKIAPLTLQLLIENAVKHNRMSVSEPLIITVSFEEPEMLIIKNKLQPRSTPSVSTGIGLQNIMNRYTLLTNRSVWAGEANDHFVVKIPLITETTK